MNESRPRIMLVDDESDLLELYGESLTGMDVTLVWANDGLEAIAHLEDGSFDIIVTDLSMPGASGVEVIKAAARLSPDTDVIVLTAYGTIDSAVECVKLGAVNYLRKPFDVHKFRATLAQALKDRAERHGRQTPGTMSRMLALSSALHASGGIKDLIREFLSQVKGAFSPDGIAFVVNGPRETAPGSRAFIGPYFRENPPARPWFENLAATVAAKGRPALLEASELHRSFLAGMGRCPAPGSAMAAPVGGASRLRGAVVALRRANAPSYTRDELNLLTLFAAHASLCFESRSASARLKSANDEFVFSLVHAVEAKDPYTRGHSERVSRYGVELARVLGLSEREVELVRKAGVLHDIGKIGVPDRILNKKGPLVGNEMPIMRQHPVIARTILGKVESFAEVLPIVYHHHERFDGKGYPDGLGGEDIPFLARLVSVVDGYEAMTSDRAYQSARSADAARDILLAGAGTQWDAGIVRAWIGYLENSSAA